MNRMKDYDDFDALFLTVLFTTIFYSRLLKNIYFWL